MVRPLPRLNRRANTYCRRVVATRVAGQTNLTGRRWEGVSVAARSVSDIEIGVNGLNVTLQP